MKSSNLGEVTQIIVLIGTITVIPKIHKIIFSNENVLIGKVN